MKLYEYSEQYRKALDELSETEEIPEEVIRDTIEALEGVFMDKAVSVAAFIRNIESEVSALDKAIENMDRRRTSKKKKLEWMKEYLRHNMEALGKIKLETPEFVVSIKINPESVIVLDPSLVPEEFKRTKTEIVLDKKAIKEAGGCAGAILARTNRLEIR